MNNNKRLVNALLIVTMGIVTAVMAISVVGDVLALSDDNEQVTVTVEKVHQRARLQRC